MEKNSDQTPKRSTNYAKYSGMGLQMLGTIGLGTYAGVKLDEWQGNKTLQLKIIDLKLSDY